MDWWRSQIWFVKSLYSQLICTQQCRANIHKKPVLNNWKIKFWPSFYLHCFAGGSGWGQLVSICQYLGAIWGGTRGASCPSTTLVNIWSGHKTCRPCTSISIFMKISHKILKSAHHVNARKVQKRQHASLSLQNQLSTLGRWWNLLRHQVQSKQAKRVALISLRDSASTLYFRQAE